MLKLPQFCNPSLIFLYLVIQMTHFIVISLIINVFNRMLNGAKLRRKKPFSNGNTVLAILNKK